MVVKIILKFLNKITYRKLNNFPIFLHLFMQIIKSVCLVLGSVARLKGSCRTMTQTQVPNLRVLAKAAGVPSQAWA